MKKKLMALLLALAMVMGVSVNAFAEETSTTPSVSTSANAAVANGGTFTFEKEYKVTGTAPTTTFSFTVSNGSVTGSDATDALTKQFEVADVTFTETEANTTKNVTVTLPTYTQVGVYTYTLSEVDNDVAGVTTTGPLTLTVYVINGDNGLECRVNLKYEGEKVKGFSGNTLANKYDSGSLSISKNVTGNMGDKTKYFKVTVTLTGEENKTYLESYSVSGGSYASNPSTIEIGEATVFYLKDGDTIKIENLPAGVTYTVVEDDYTNDGYKAAQYTYSDTNKSIAANDTDTVAIENNKDTGVETGISVDSLPYVMLLGLVAAAGVVFFVRKNMARED